MLFHEFSKSNLSQVHTIFVSDHSVLSKFKTCQIVVATSMIRQFHEFSKNKFISVSHNFRFRSLCALHIQNLSNCCRHKYDPSMSRIFWTYFLTFFFQFGPTVHRNKIETYHLLKRHCLSQWQRPTKRPIFYFRPAAFLQSIINLVSLVCSVLRFAQVPANKTRRTG